MARGENIYKRKDGRWEARYIKKRDISGKIIYGFVYGKTYHEAKQKVTKCKSDILTRSTINNNCDEQILSFYCDQWLCFRKTQIKAASYIKYNTILTKYIKPYLGNLYPHQITTSLINDFSYNLFSSELLSNKYIHDILIVLKSIIKFITTHFSISCPITVINYPKKPKNQMRILSIDEQDIFVNYLLSDIDNCKFGLLITLFTGIRIGELCALKWENISFTEKTLRVNRTLQRLSDIEISGNSKTRIIIGSPKSDTSTRIIPLNKSLLTLCEKMYIRNDNAYILTGTNEYMEPRVLQYRIKKYTKECGLEDIHCHTLRHTFATRAVEVGFELKSLSEILGHSTTTITLERYVHSSLELKRKNMDKISYDFSNF